MYIYMYVYLNGIKVWVFFEKNIEKKHLYLNDIKVRLFFGKKTSEKSTCAVMIRIIINFENQMFL